MKYVKERQQLFAFSFCRTKHPYSTPINFFGNAVDNTINIYYLSAKSTSLRAGVIMDIMAVVITYTLSAL
jgi:hypothetical protein